MSSEDFEKIKIEKAELLAQLEEAKLAYQQSLDELDKQKDAVEQAARNYRILVNKVEADLHEVPPELRKIWETEDKAAKAASDRDQAIDAIQEGLRQMSKGFTALGNRLGNTFEKFGESVRNLAENQEAAQPEDQGAAQREEERMSNKEQADSAQPEEEQMSNKEQAHSAQPEERREEKPEAKPDQAKGSKRIVIELEEPKRAGAIEPPYMQGDPHR